MNLVLLVWLCILEVAFVFTAIFRKADKKGWQMGRLICNAGQLVLFLIMLIAPGIDMSFRFTGLFALLIVRILVSFIEYMIIRKKEGKKKHPAKMVLSALMSILLISGSLIPSFVFPPYDGLPVSGEYDVAKANAILVDESRVEEFESDGSKREVPVYFFYPSNAEKNEKLPLVVFSHGAFGYYESNFSTYSELASNGYVVISVEHPYHSIFTHDTSGKMIIADGSFLNGAMGINAEGATEQMIFELSSEWLKLRCDDLNFVIDSVKSAAGDSTLPEYWNANERENENIITALSMTDTDKIGVMGHSLGGAAAAALGRTRSDISAVVDLDGTMLGEVIGVENERDILISEPYTTPILSFDNEEHHFSAEAAREANVPYANNSLHENAVCGYRTYIAGSGHMNFTDLPMFSPVLAKNLGTGTVDASECMVTVNRITREFFDRFLKGEGEFIVSECISIS
ncbi:MAG: alpha/beta hydrolase family protein [Oscillospiraceae bacterium]